MAKITKLFIVFGVFFSVHLFSQNLLTNGDFESGGSGNGFTVPNYNLYTGGGGITPGNYAISNNPTPLNNFFIPNIMDHSPGAGNNMMVVDGSTNANASFWSAGNNASGLCGLVIGSTYTFSYWIRTISSTTVDNTTQPNIAVNFTNATGTLIFGDPTVGLPTETWQQVFYNFVPTATCVNINLVNINTSPAGNDFALDDLEVTLQLCPLTILSITNPDTVCEPNTVDITDPAVTAGSIGGGVLTYWEDPAGTIPLITPPPSAINVSGTYYIRSSSGPTCSDIKPVLVSIKPVIIPVFTPVAPICEGDVLAPLPTLSNNGVIGSWSPALDNTNTTTYTFTPDPNPTPNLVVNGDFSDGNTGFSTSYTNIPTSNGTTQGVYGIVTNSNLWFNSLSSCNDHTGAGGNFMVADGSVSNGGNDSLWCQTIPVQAGENYIFSFFAQSVSSGSPANFEVTINGFSIGSSTLDFSTCNWMQSSFPWNSSTATTANICIYDRNTTSFGNDFGIDDISFVPTSIQCAEPVDMTIVVNPAVTPTFDAVAPICEGDALAPLPTTSLEGITGIWSPVLDNTTTTVYTFTPDAGQCTAIPLTELTITVNPSNVTPTFDAIAPICEGDALAPLPTTSLEGITGVWSPALDNTMTTTYTFTPDAGQCAVNQTIDITVNTQITPTFNAVAPICEGDALAPLPTTSLEGITGTWSPALDNTMTTTYTFTPAVGQCTTIPLTELIITVNPNVTPTFNPVVAICEGDALAPLPTTSLEGITGAWSPALNNTTTTAYTFTPDAGQCTTTPLTQLTITVNTPITPTFDAVAPICEGDALAPLPTTSLEGITGAWSPVLDNTITTTYTFTPDAGQCTATPLTQLTITVNPSNVIPTFDPVAPICEGDVLAPLPTTSLERITGAWSPALDNTMTTTYTFTPDASQCATIQTIIITVNTLITPTFNPVIPICEGDALAPLPTTSLEGITGAWSPALNNTVTTTYTFTPDAGQCTSTPLTELTIAVNPRVTPIFDPVVPICEGDALAALPITSNNGIVGSWSPALDNTTTTTYTFTPNPVPSTSNLIVNGDFSLGNTGFITDYIYVPAGNTDARQYTVATNPRAWNVGFANCQGNGGVNNFLIVNGSAINGGNDRLWCQTINVNPGEIYQLSYFSQTLVTASPARLEIEINGVSIGTNTFPSTNCNWVNTIFNWNSGTSTSATICIYNRNIDLFGNDFGIDDISFVPTSIQCAEPVDMTIVVSPRVTPTFNPVATICEGDALAPLPTTSLEGITGTWSPALDNTMTTTYTFTPNAGQCTVTLLTQLTITVNPIVTPTFNAVAPICEGDALAPLPTTSLEGITGTWSPALDNTLTTLYTFEPDAGQCASNERLEIVVNIPLNPDFEELTPICEGEIAPVLQNTSPNGITGTWNPATVDNFTSDIYTFTPDAGQCATTWELYMQINQPTLTNVICEVGEPFSGNRTITVYASLDGFYEYQLDGGVPQYENVFENVEPGTHTVTVSDVNGCSASITKEVIIIDYPKFFTPNGDGYNDYWNIVGLNQPDAKIYIFDRYGKLLKQISSESQGWDGTFNGEQLPSTDYWFTVDFVDVADDSTDKFKAHFSLKR